jgi:LuxR family maltose regulon positive regulatory protein
LLEKVAEGAHRRLLLVSAPAGYGKSTLIAEAAARLDWTTAWYKLDVLDHDPTVLVASLTEAIRRQVAGFGEVVVERLSNSREVPITVSELLALFVHELEDEVKLTLHLVLDDYHEASASLGLNKALDFVLANLPAHVHLVLLTRFEPSFSARETALQTITSLFIRGGSMAESGGSLARRSLRHGKHAQTTEAGRSVWC